MKTMNMCTIDLHDTAKGVNTVPDFQPLPTKHNPYPLIILTHLTQKTAHGSHKSSDKMIFSLQTQLFQDQHNTTKDS